jgi:hypothetical protein
VNCDDCRQGAERRPTVAQALLFTPSFDGLVPYPSPAVIARAPAIAAPARAARSQDRHTRLGLVRFGYFVKLDQDFPSGIGWRQKEINTSIVRAGPGLRVNGCQAEVFRHKRRGAIHIQAAKFHLLNSLAESFEKASEGSISEGISGRQDVQGYPGWKLKLEFFNILVGRDAGKRRVAIRSLDARERLREYRQAHGNWLPPYQTVEFTMRRPGRHHGARKCHTLIVNPRGRSAANGGVGRQKAEDVRVR